VNGAPHYAPQMTPLALEQIVDLSRYPIDRLDDPDGRALVARARTALHEAGACDLPGFLLPDATDAAAESALTVRDRAFRTERTHDIDFSGLAGESLQEGDPRRTAIRSAKEGTALDDIPAHSPVLALYQSDALLRFVGAALEIDPLFRSDDPLGALNYMYYGPADELGWHFDNADFVVTLMLQAPERGGHFEFAPMLRSEGDRNDAGVRALLAGDRSRIRTMSGEPGTLALFRGHLSPHRVTPVEGSRTRVNAVLSYARTPGHRLGDETYRLFYGRVPA
jgi:2OG-Fe(II) oxygenase superfamily